jgi:hypothetical protein
MHSEQSTHLLLVRHQHFSNGCVERSDRIRAPDLTPTFGLLDVTREAFLLTEHQVTQKSPRLHRVSVALSAQRFVSVCHRLP